MSQRVGSLTPKGTVFQVEGMACQRPRVQKEHDTSSRRTGCGKLDHWEIFTYSAPASWEKSTGMEVDFGLSIHLVLAISMFVDMT